MSRRSIDRYESRWIGFGALAALAALLGLEASGDSLVISEPFAVSDDYATGDTFMNVRLQGTVRLMPKELNGFKPRELSGLAWDADEGLLYAVSDDGFLVHLRPVFDAGILERVYLDDAFPLRGQDGVPVKKKYADAEGLVARHTRNGIAGDTELIISFERKPRLVRYTPQGDYVAATPLPEILRDGSRYSGRNKELEALTELDDFGLITGPERPLKDSDQSKIPLYSISGHTWLYAPVDAEHSALVGLESNARRRPVGFGTALRVDIKASCFLVATHVHQCRDTDIGTSGRRRRPLRHRRLVYR